MINSFEPFQAHKLVVCLQSEVIATLVESSISTSVGGRSCIYLSDNDSKTIKIMLKFLYTKNYEPSDAAGKLLCFEAKIYAAAEKYGIIALRHMAARNYETALEAEWNTESFPESLKLIYERSSGSDRLLKDIAINFAATKARELADQPAFAALCKENGQIGYEVLTASLKQTNLQSTSKAGLGRAIEPNREAEFRMTKEELVQKMKQELLRLDREESLGREKEEQQKRKDEAQRKGKARNTPIFGQNPSTVSTTPQSNKPDGVCANGHKIASNVYWATFVEGSRKCPTCNCKQINWSWSPSGPEVPKRKETQNEDRIQCAQQ